MKIKLDQLAEHLKKTLAPVYLVAGDEALLCDEACEAIRHKAQQTGFDERTIFILEDQHFNIDLFKSNFANLSLFADKKILELICLLEKIPEKVSKFLLSYLQAPFAENCLIIRCKKISAEQQRTAWFKALLNVGIFLPIWPIDPVYLPRWVANRLRKHQLTTNETGLRLLAQSGENNLFAIAQQIEKLHILYGSGMLSEAQITTVIQDQAHFQLFDLVDPVLRGDKGRALRILMRLQEENTEPSLILWVLRENSLWRNHRYHPSQYSNSKQEDCSKNYQKDSLVTILIYCSLIMKSIKTL